LLRSICPVRTLTLIVAEDDHFMREWLSLSLEGLAASVVQAANGHELVALLGERPDVDLVISDIRMPGPSGLDALALARGAGSDVPFLLITGYGSSDVLAAASELGAAVLQKPFSRRDLLARVNALCRSAAAGPHGARPARARCGACGIARPEDERLLRRGLGV
jgi:DNA-binding response OmpR family regulator